MNESLASLASWSKRRWIAAAVTSLLTGLVIALPTAVLNNPIFGREIEPTSWSLPVVIVTSILSGLLLATYISNDPSLNEEKSIKIGGAGAFFSFLAVGCPVCNKIVLVALGSSGAIQYFAPVQPFLAGIGIALLVYALRKRLVNELKCAMKFPKIDQDMKG
jgi:hypothetical protein